MLDLGNAPEAAPAASGASTAAFSTLPLSDTASGAFAPDWGFQARWVARRTGLPLSVAGEAARAAGLGGAA